MRRCDGIVLLVLLFVLLAGSASWLSAVPDPVPRPAMARAASTSNAGLQPALERRRRAREALLAYATLYAWSYGPTGAGPGHLPCPDTDTVIGRPGAPPSPAPRDPALAGPNPPCAARPAASGALALHVRTGRERIALDPAGRYARPLVYRVAAYVVNNPRGRIVNGARLPTVIAELDGLAITAGALRAPLERAVAAWAIARLAEVRPIVPAAARCASRGCDLLDLLAPGDRLLEGVPQARHWFARNGWRESFEVEAGDACLSAPARCAWRIAPDASAAASVPAGRSPLRLIGRLPAEGAES